MTELEYDIIIPIKIQCASPAHAEVLTAWIAKDVAYGEEGDGTGPMGEYSIASGEARVEKRTVAWRALLREDATPFEPTSYEPLVETVEALVQVAETNEALVDAFETQPTQEPPAPEPPAPEKERRRRTKTWPGTDVVTAGIKPETCDALVAAIATPEAQALATALLSRFTQPVFGVLREEEGQALLEQIRGLAPTPVAPEAPALAEEAPVKPGGPSEGDTVYTRFGVGTVESVAADTLIVKVEGTGRSMNFYRREISLTPVPVVPPAILPGQIKCAVSGEPKDPAYCKPDACENPVACRAAAHPAPVGTPVVPPWLRGGKA
jgi:hypothetical protein